MSRPWEFRGFERAEAAYEALMPPEPHEPSEEEADEQDWIDHLLERGERAADAEWDEP